jgi:hypothetical protein
MTKRRIAVLIAGTLLTAQAAVAANYGDPSPYQGNDQNPPRYYQSDRDGRGAAPGYTYSVPNVRYAPMQSESWDNPAYNASSVPDNFPWFGDELLGQRPNPTQSRYFERRAAQVAGRTSTDMSRLPPSDDLRGQQPQGTYSYERDRGAGNNPPTAVCRDSYNHPMPC